jgi:prophage tail gpP-like protein
VSDVRLVVNGRKYGGWKSVRVTRSIETLAGTFEVDATDRWGDQAQAWAIAEEDECCVEIDDDVVIDGYVDRRGIQLSKDQRTLSFAGRDKAAQLVDCSAVPDQWTYRKVGVLEIARALAEPFDIPVTAQSGLSLSVPAKFTVNPGDSVFDAIERLAQIAGALAVSDGAGGVLFTRTGTGRATALVEGGLVLSASVDYNASDRFHRYVVATQTAGEDGASADATRIRAEATDADVRLTSRVLLIRPDSGVATAYARQRGDWEARIRAARAETVSVSVVGWQQPNGDLWPVNAMAAVRIPSIGVDGDMLISSTYFSLGEDGETTTLRLVRPDAFTPEPDAVVQKGGGKWWKTLDRDSDGRFRRVAM